MSSNQSVPPKSVGKVYLVGAGPGDPGLITVKGMECIRQADVIVYDRLVHPALLTAASKDAEVLYVGKEPGAHTMKQEDINRLLADKAMQGKVVVRLKGGDPFVFGRGGEEAEFLAEHGIPFEVVPGVTSAIAVPAYAGIPVTHRGVSRSFLVISGHEASECTESQEITTQARVIRQRNVPDTLVFLMGMQNLTALVQELTASGWDPTTPVAVIRWGTWPGQETLVATLETISSEVERVGFKPPAVFVIGEVVRLRDRLRWFDNRPLFGKRILVTRSRDQASALSELLRRHGAEPIEFPVIKIVPPANLADLDRVLGQADKYDWILFTSVNAVYALKNRLEELGKDIRMLKGPKVGVIGPRTAEAVRNCGMRVDFVPSEFVAESVAAEFPEAPGGKRILIPRAADARDTLPRMLSERGALVETVAAYQTILEEVDVESLRRRLADGEIDIITFTSSSTVRNFVKLLGKSIPENVGIACIGPVTAQTAKEFGLEPTVIADSYTIEGLVDKLLEAYGKSSTG